VPCVKGMLCAGFANLNMGPRIECILSAVGFKIVLTWCTRYSHIFENSAYAAHERDVMCGPYKIEHGGRITDPHIECILSAVKFTRPMHKTLFKCSTITSFTDA